MALFQRKDMQSPITLKYSLSTNEQKRLIVGLGNIGEEYEGTRHNIGFDVIDALAESYDVTFVTKKDLFCKQAIVHQGNTQIILAKPNTFMNDSGRSVRALLDYYQIPESHALIVHDELDLPLGEVRGKVGGSSAGQNGVKSVISHTKNEFHRLRIGIGPKSPAEMDSADFVLQKFKGPEKRKLLKVVDSSLEYIRAWLA